MARTILIDEFHLSVTVAAGFQKTEYDAIHRTLISRRFRLRLREAARKVFRRYPSLKKTRFAVSQ